MMRIVPIRPASTPEESTRIGHGNDRRTGPAADDERFLDQLLSSEDSELSYALLRALFPERTDASRRVPKVL